MLVLSRRESERIKLGDSIVVTVVRVTGDRVRLGIEAPSDVLVLRSELEGEVKGELKGQDSAIPTQVPTHQTPTLWHKSA